ncbi:hypothetical protein FK517_20590 [Klebsiella pneumoniae]|nr:hypothetical protein [Klebsiella pneumoniae]HBX8105029.1 hypothetical protein [Klebsiella pneumoniae]
MAKHSGCPAKGKRPPSNAFLHDVCLTASPYPAYGSSTGSNSVGPRKRSAAGRYTSDTVPAVVPDGGINALSGLRVLCWFKQRRPAQAQRRRAAGDRTEFDEESGCRKAKTRLLGGFFK